MKHDDRERLGRIVREVWIAWAREQEAPKPSWLVPWDGLSEPDREVDRRIGERLAREGTACPDCEGHYIVRLDPDGGQHECKTCLYGYLPPDIAAHEIKRAQRLSVENAALRDALVRWKVREEEYDVLCSENPDGGGPNPKALREAGARCDAAAVALRRLVG